MDVTAKLADFIFALRHKKLPVEVYEKAKLHPGRSTEAEGINRAPIFIDITSTKTYF